MQIKQLIILTLLFMPLAYANKLLQTTCINKNIEKIKTETQC